MLFIMNIYYLCKPARIYFYEKNNLILISIAFCGFVLYLSRMQESLTHCKRAV